MKTFFIYGFVLGLTLASPITRFQECKECLMKVGYAENNGDQQEKMSYIQIPRTAETAKVNSAKQQLLNNTVKKYESVVKKQSSNIEIKHHYRRDLSLLRKKHNGGKKHRPKKIIQCNSVYNRSRKIQDLDTSKHSFVKGRIMKHLQKRSIDYEDTAKDPYHSPDISYEWDTQEDFSENDHSQESNDSAGLTKNTDDFTPSSIGENNDPNDSSQSKNTSSIESRNSNGSLESSSPAGPTDSNGSNESSESNGSPEYRSHVGPIEADSLHGSTYNNEGEESISNVTNEARDSPESLAFTTPGPQWGNDLSESRLLNESWNQDKSSQHNESRNSGDSSSNESDDSCNSDTSCHSSESTITSQNSTEISSQYIKRPVITDDIEENEIHV